MPENVLIIGIGNPLRSDDGLGWRVADMLKRDAALPPGVRFETRHQLLPEMMDGLAASDLAILIDAAADLAPGEIRRKQIKPADSDSRSMTHDWTPEALLGSTKTLYGRAPETWLVTVGAASFEHGEEISNVVANVLPELRAQLLKWVEHGSWTDLIHHA